MLTQHAIKRAKERFGYSEAILDALLKKIRQGQGTLRDSRENRYGNGTLLVYTVFTPSHLTRRRRVTVVVDSRKERIITVLLNEREFEQQRRRNRV
jgi:hypothetical protein